MYVNLKMCLSIFVISVFSCTMCFAEQISFDDAYTLLGLVKNRQEVESLGDKFKGCSIKWNLSVKAKYKSGKPLFNELRKKADESTKVDVARFDFTDKEIELWKKFKSGDKVVVKGTVAYVDSINFKVADGSSQPFVFLVVTNMIPCSTVTSSEPALSFPQPDP